MREWLDVLRALLPTGLRRWWPSTRGVLDVTRVEDDGTLVVGRSRRRVLRVRGEPLDSERDAPTALRHLAAALNQDYGTLTLVAIARPGGLDAELSRRRERSQSASLTPVRRSLAGAQHAHLKAISRGEVERAGNDPTPSLPARRYSFYLLLEAKRPEQLGRFVAEACRAFNAEEATAAEALLADAHSWRGIPLPPPTMQHFIRHTAHDEELVITPRGARVRRVSAGTALEAAEGMALSR